MTKAPIRAVIDASVAVKLFVPEPFSAQAQTVFQRFAAEEGAELIVPDLFFIECANVFWKWVQRAGYAVRDAQDHLRDLMGLGLTVIPGQAIADGALGTALRYRITAYDACYLVIASHLRLPLITADEKLARQIAGGAFDVRWLGDVTPAGPI